MKKTTSLSGWMTGSYIYEPVIYRYYLGRVSDKRYSDPSQILEDSENAIPDFTDFTQTFTRFHTLVEDFKAILLEIPTDDFIKYVKK